MSNQYEAIIIGTGQSGPALAGRLNAEGLRTAIIERGLVGGTCVNVGCIPTKTLVASARAAYMAREAPRFGVQIPGDIAVDMVAVKARKDEISGASNRGVTSWIEGMDNVDLIRGHASFTGPNAVEINGETIEAEKIFINVGGRARVPDWEGIDEIPFLNNSSMMDVDFLPQHLIIVGGSYIGLEFAQMYRRFGSEVTVVEKHDRIIGRDDDDVSNAVRKILEGEGVQFRLNADCFRVRKTDTGVAIRVSCDEGPEEVTGSHLLAAVGRDPNTDDLGVDRAGVETNRFGFINVDDQLRTSVPGIWAIGDVNGRGAFTHTSYNDYEIVVANLFDDDPRKVTDRILCYGLFVDPPLGRIGMTEREVRASGKPALIGKRMMTQVGRAREFGETRGFIKIIVDAETEEILGAAILGLNGDEVIHCLLDTMYARRPYTVIARAVHIHPTVAELIPTVLQGMVPLE
ncbi:MAG: FAD-containing oxidoreductase [Gammaproteobacteria bacterium]|nr:FAD-containing oxidoreductase [Gammaproteobacteria bacterium]MDH3857555.1 FAD-containing oxidoreductase [Gammaproteobacteria bacterium]